MADPQTSIQGVRDRLTGLLADWGSELSAVLKELEDKRARLEELESRTAGRDGELQALQKRLDGQESLIEALKGDAEDASKLRKEVRSKDLEFERLSSELGSKKELIRALRRDAEGVDKLKAEAKVKDRAIEDLTGRLQRADQRKEALGKEIVALRESAIRESEESTELEAMRAELEARKSLIKSLRADQERVGALEARLEEKSEVIEQLEGSINRHANTIAELKRSVEGWKRKYQAAQGGGSSSGSTTSVSMPVLSDTDVRAIESLEKKGEAKSDSTIAIDMRRSLLEARRTAQSNEK